MINKFYEKMYTIRRFEKTILELFSRNLLNGTTHTYIGQEAVAVAAMNNIEKSDFVFSNHRCHGHFIAYSGCIEILLSEIMGKRDGMCRGRGGSQHICYGRFMTNGVQGGIVPNATGIAYASKIIGEESIVVVFLGDGTLGQGVVYESFNLASLYSVPILFVVEDNGYAMTTKTSEGVAGSIVKRAEAFNIACSEIGTNDVLELNREFCEAVSYVREQKKPFCQVVHTYRLGPHSKGDDMRDINEIEEHKAFDPLILAEQKMISADIESIKCRVDTRIEQAVSKCMEQDVDDAAYMLIPENIFPACGDSLLAKWSEKSVHGLNRGFDTVMGTDSRIFFLGEDIKDPYGGPFKVTRGLSEKYPDRVVNTPVSEAGIIGFAIGMAINGLKPVVEMMFGDFISLGFDQILNHATKYNWMYANQVQVPLLIRLPSGGGRGYGATHSQSLEKFFAGIPNLNIIALSQLHDPQILAGRILSNITSPTLLIENKMMYSEQTLPVTALRSEGWNVSESQTLYPVIRLTYDETVAADLTIITYGAFTGTAIKVAKRFMLEREIMVNVISLTQISPVDYPNLISMISGCTKIVTLEEGTKRMGIGSEIVSTLAENLSGVSFLRIASRDCVIPAGMELERYVFNDANDIFLKLGAFLNEQD